MVQWVAIIKIQLLKLKNYVFRKWPNTDEIDDNFVNRELNILISDIVLHELMSADVSTDIRSI